MTDEYTEYKYDAGRIFYMGTAFGHIIFDPTTNKFEESRGFSFGST